MSQGQKKNNDPSSLIGQLLIATPQLQDRRFHQAVIFICGYDENGAMGLVINKLIDSLTLGSLFEQMDIPIEKFVEDVPVHFGGPVEMGRGFILHSTDRIHKGSVKLTDTFALSSTVDVLKTISKGKGPKDLICALGYSGWGAGQLEAELQTNSWLQVDADPELVFHTPVQKQWKKALDKLGIDPDLLSLDAGHA